MKTTGTVICNYNKKDYVLRCIQSVLESDSVLFLMSYMKAGSAGNQTVKKPLCSPWMMHCIRNNPVRDLTPVRAASGNKSSSPL